MGKESMSDSWERENDYSEDYYADFILGLIRRKFFVFYFNVTFSLGIL